MGVNLETGWRGNGTGGKDGAAAAGGPHLPR